MNVDKYLGIEAPVLAEKRIQPLLYALAAESVPSLVRELDAIVAVEEIDSAVAWIHYHGLSGLVWRLLGKSSDAAVWHPYFAAPARRSLIGMMGVTRQMQSVARQLQDAGIQAVFLKGADLAHTIYPALGMRTTADLDILIPREQIAAAVSRLEMAGYRQTDVPEPSFSGKPSRHYPPLKPPADELVEIELHWTLAPAEDSWVKTDMGWFWQQIEPIDLQGKPLTVLRPAAHLIYLAVHMVLLHGMQTIAFKWLFDIHYFVKKHGETADFWDEVVAAAHVHGWEAAVASALAMSQEWLGTAVPDQIINRLQAAADPQMSHFAAKQMQSQKSRKDEALGHIDLLLPAARRRALLRLLVPAPLYMRWRYQLDNGWQLPFAYMNRWYKLIEGFAARILQEKD